MKPIGTPKAHFRFQVTAVPDSRYNIVEPGDYQFTVTVGARNAERQSVVMRLRFDGYWSQDTAVMFRDHVSLTIVKPGDEQAQVRAS